MGEPTVWLRLLGCRVAMLPLPMHYEATLVHTCRGSEGELTGHNVGNWYGFTACHRLGLIFYTRADVGKRSSLTIINCVVEWGTLIV